MKTIHINNIFSTKPLYMIDINNTKIKKRIPSLQLINYQHFNLLQGTAAKSANTEPQ